MNVGIMASAVVSSGFGPEQRVTIGGAPNTDILPNYEIGTRVQFARAGRITKIRYYRMTSTSTSVLLSVWNSGGTRLSGAHSTSVGGGTAGYQTFTLPTPVAVTAGAIMTFSIGGGVLPLHSGVLDTATNTADCTVISVSLYNPGTGNFPNTAGGSSVYVEPIYEPAI